MEWEKLVVETGAVFWQEAYVLPSQLPDAPQLVVLICDFGVEPSSF